MAPKKAPKKAAAKKMAPKAAKGPAHTQGKDLRRAYEHMGRLEALGPLLDETAAAEIQELLRFAHSSLAAEDSKIGAELLRAGEHLAFGSLASELRDTNASDSLQNEAREECEHLLERAGEHWDRHESERAWPLDSTYRKARKQAEQAVKQGALRRALEFARAAEALGHVRGAPSALPAGRERARIRSGSVPQVR